MAEVDLFGEVPAAAIEPPRGKHYTRPNGYAARPGTGPTNETCGSCKHACRQKNYSGNKRWLKRGSDILAGSPACSQWSSEHPSANGRALATSK